MELWDTDGRPFKAVPWRRGALGLLWSPIEDVGRSASMVDTGPGEDSAASH